MQLEEHLKENPPVPCNEDSKKKERHIVSWSQEEDDILREQISIHGTENWAIIASKFKDKTTRQCRRRWYTYLNSDFKKGGWSPEEDMLLCEAQKIFGNRWTEIAKVVSGRTDNAVKNRFSTLCKKRAKYEALAKENAASYVNQNNKRCLVQSGSKTDGMSEASAPIKRIRRSHIPASATNCNYGDRLHRPNATTAMNQQPRPPFAVLVQSSCNVNNLDVQHHVRNAKEIIHDAQSKIQGTFLNKDDPKVTALMQQAELLSSLAEKVNTENTDQSFENAWKVLQEFLNRSKEGDIFRYKISDTESVDLELEDLKDLVEDLWRSSNEGSERSWRQPDLSEESPCSSEYSTGSTLLPPTTGDNTKPTLAEISPPKLEIGIGFSEMLSQKTSVGECENGVPSGATINQDTILVCDEQMNNDGVTSALSSNEFGSPLHVTPIFRSLAAGIPSPKFSESERNFLLKTLGVESSPSTNPSINASQPPPCKRALLKSL